MVGIRSPRQRVAAEAIRTTQVTAEAPQKGTGSAKDGRKEELSQYPEPRTQNPGSAQANNHRASLHTSQDRGQDAARFRDQFLTARDALGCSGLIQLLTAVVDASGHEASSSRN
ncbi:predicted protein [Histoplasma capsulatum G186AR]|uniref:Uncharacterized protein n=1 Tax=Ajellomyces capsulatus (strain G186AR / H82 / ATCC MYA-2454 / RMSCC 2432) TaxID=447093 RepID=C0NBB9_AJECG|nr:uncharacterized protein HCBG_00415 [Histoplasma capsulatum G186AR]EEH10960.1 predicted protein [Histoplasma capsulatum G186AR]